MPLPLKLIQLILLPFLLLSSNSLFAHAGPHGNDECLINMGGFEIRLNGYQFQGKFPDKHYCRHFPYLGQTIIKLDSITSDLTDVSIELQLLQRQSWLGLLLQHEDAFSLIKQRPKQSFSKQVVAISADLKTLDLYAIKLKLHHKQGQILEQRFLFIAGLPFTKIMVGIAFILLLFIIIIFFKPSNQSLRKTES